MYIMDIYKLDRHLGTQTFDSYNRMHHCGAFMSNCGYTIFVEDAEGHDMRIQTLRQYLAYHRSILMDLCVWKKMTDAEKDEFDAANSKEMIDRLQERYRRKYF